MTRCSCCDRRCGLRAAASCNNNAADKSGAPRARPRRGNSERSGHGLRLSPPRTPSSLEWLQPPRRPRLTRTRVLRASTSKRTSSSPPTPRRRTSQSCSGFSEASSFRSLGRTLAHAVLEVAEDSLSPIALGFPPTSAAPRSATRSVSSRPTTDSRLRLLCQAS